MADIKFKTWEIEGLRYSHPYVVKFDFMLSDHQIQEKLRFFEGRWDMKLMGKNLYFRLRTERCQFLEMLTR